MSDDMVPLREYLEARINDLSRRHDADVVSIRRTADVTASSLAQRLDGMNEFRRQLETQAGQFLTKDAYDERHNTLVDRITRIESQAAGARRAVGTFYAVAGIGVAVLAVAVTFLLHYS